MQARIRATLRAVSEADELPPTPPERAAGRRDLVAVFAAALVVRLAHAACLSSTPWFRGPIIDSQTYHQIAAALANGAELTQPFYQPPLYPWVLSLMYRAGLSIGWGVAIVQSVLGAATCALVVVVGRRMLEGAPDERRAVGLVAGTVAAFCGPLVLYDLELLAPVVVNFLLVLALALAATGPPRPSWRDAAAGLSIGIAATGWVPALVVAPVAVFARRVEGRRWLSAILVGVALLPPLAVTALHNARHGAPGTVVSWNGGLNLWLGNGPTWREKWRARPGAEFEPEYERPGRHGAVTPVEQDAWFQRAVWEDVEARPGAAVLRTLEKLYYAWHGREIRRNQDFEILREASPVLAVLQWELGLCFPFGILAPFALLSAWRRRRERGARGLAAGAAAYSLVLAVYFVATRYRLPMLLLLLPLAADTAARLLRKEWPTRSELGALAAAIVVLNAPVPFTATFRADEKERHLLHAEAWMNQGRLDRAAAIARRALRRWPDDANVNMLAATIAMRDDDCARAIPHLEAVVRAAPIASTPRIDLASCFERFGRLDEAERQYAQVLARSPFHGRAIRAAALLYMRHGRPEHAIALLRRLRASGQGDAGTNFDLGRLLVETGRYEEALEVLRPLARRSPGDEELRALVRRAETGARSGPSASPARRPAAPRGSAQ